MGCSTAQRIDFVAVNASGLPKFHEFLYPL